MNALTMQVASACAAGESGGDGDDPNDRGKAIDDHRLDATEASKMIGSPLYTAWETAWYEYHARFPSAALDPDLDPDEWPDSEDGDWYVSHDLQMLVDPDDQHDQDDPESWHESFSDEMAFCALYGRVEDGFDLPESSEIFR